MPPRENSEIHPTGALNEYAQVVELGETLDEVEPTPTSPSQGFLDEHPHLRDTLIAGVVAAGLTGSPPALQEAEAGILGTAIKVATMRAAGESALRRIDYEKAVRELEELKLNQAAAEKAYNTGLSLYLEKNRNSSEGDFLRSAKGIELHDYLLAMMKGVSDFKEAHPYLKK